MTSNAISAEHRATRELYLRISTAAGNARNTVSAIADHIGAYRPEWVAQMRVEADALTQAADKIAAALDILEAAHCNDMTRAALAKVQP